VSLETDCILAVCGILSPVITPRTLAASQVIPHAWEKRLRRWVTAELKDFRYHAPPDMERVWMKLATPLNQAELEPLVAGLGLDPIAVADLWLDLTAARDYVTGVWPKFTVDTLAGPKILPLSADDTEEIGAVLGVLEDPERLLEEMEAHTLTASQVTGFKAAFPDLYDFANKAVDAEITERQAKNMEWSPGWEKEATLRVLRGSPPEDPVKPAPAPPAPPKQFKVDAERDKTQGQVSAAPKGGK
jgi:hypothetical protein